MFADHVDSFESALTPVYDVVMIRICVWIGICATLFGCGPQNQAAGDGRSASLAEGSIESWEEPLQSLMTSQFSEISERYSASAAAFESLAEAMDQDRDVVQVHCDDNLRYVQTKSSIFYEGEESEVLTSFLELCRFEEKVVASNGDSVGVKFPHSFHEIGSLLVVTGLVRRLEDSMEVEACRDARLDEQWGHCQEVISGEWYARFTWSPICPDGVGSEEGC